MEGSSNQDEPAVTEHQKKDDYLDPVSEIAEVTENDSNISAIIIPSTTYNKTLDMIRVAKGLGEKIQLANPEILAMGAVQEGLGMSLKNNSFMGLINDIEQEWTQLVTYGDKKLSIRELTLNNGSDGALTGDQAVSSFTSFISNGALVQVPLWHSGFWISLKPVKEPDLINLEYQLAENQITLGRSTNGMVFTNYAVVFVRILTDFIYGHIVDTSLNVPAGEDVRKYIPLQDLYPFVLGLVQSMYPNGFNNVHACINSSVFTKDKKLKCSYTVKGVIDPKKLLWVNRKLLSSEHLKLMSKRAPNTVTVDEVKEYQRTLFANSEESFTVKTSHGKLITVSLKTPSILDHIINGERWVNNVIDIAEKSFTENLSIDEKNRRIAIMTKASSLGTYNHYISSLTKDDGGTVSDEATLDSVLAVLVNDDLVYKGILAGVRKHIESNIVAMVATPSYTCPKCSTDQSKEGTNDSFKEFIPMNVIECFFALCALKTSKIEKMDLDDMS